MRAPASSHRRSLSAALALLWALLIVYASLYPFTGWTLPPGAGPLELMHLRWTRWIPGFDPWSNLLGYMPLGLFLGLVAVRRGGRRWMAVLAVTAIASALSYSMEVLQQFIPRRVPSAQDWVLNSLGALIGAGAARLLDGLGWPSRWRWLHDRWLAAGGVGAAVLMLLWPVGLLFPTPLPFGLGQIGTRARDLAGSWLDGVAWAEPLAHWLEVSEVFEPASSALETTVAVLGLLAPCLLAYAASAAGWRRVGLALGVVLLGLATITLSTALNFGPDHALAWRSPMVMRAVGWAVVLAIALSWIGARLAAGLALIALTGLVLLVHQAPSDPYFAQSLQAWEQGHFIRFHGVAQWIGWLWPYAVIIWLLAREGRSGR